MTDESQHAGGSGASICGWCSATYHGDPERCPSCGATLVGDPATDPSLPGLTAIDAAQILRAKDPVRKPRNRLLSWISGEYPEQGPTAAEAGALAPPDPAVRREMLRLELAAEVASLQAEAEAMRADLIVEASEARPEEAGSTDGLAPLAGDVTVDDATGDAVDDATGDVTADDATGDARDDARPS